MLYFVFQPLRIATDILGNAKGSNHWSVPFGKSMNEYVRNTITPSSHTTAKNTSLVWWVIVQTVDEKMARPQTLSGNISKIFWIWHLYSTA